MKKVTKFYVVVNKEDGDIYGTFTSRGYARNVKAPYERIVTVPLTAAQQKLLASAQGK